MDLHLIKAPVILIMQYEYRESVSLATDKHELKFRLENYQTSDGLFNFLSLSFCTFIRESTLEKEMRNLIKKNLKLYSIQHDHINLFHRRNNFDTEILISKTTMGCYSIGRLIKKSVGDDIRVGIFSVWIDNLRRGMTSRGLGRSWSLMCSGGLQKYFEGKNCLLELFSLFYVP